MSMFLFFFVVVVFLIFKMNTLIIRELRSNSHTSPGKYWTNIFSYLSGDENLESD